MATALASSPAIRPRAWQRPKRPLPFLRQMAAPTSWAIGPDWRRAGPGEGMDAKAGGHAASWLLAAVGARFPAALSFHPADCCGVDWAPAVSDAGGCRR